MADIVARDDLAPGSVARSRNSHRAMADRGAQANQPPRTDVGTLLLHWVTAIAFVVSLFTGIRIAADALHAPVSKWLSPVLPQGQIWTFHFYAGLTLFFCAAAYFVYMRRASLFSRNAFKKTRVIVMPVASKMRFGGLRAPARSFSSREPSKHPPIRSAQSPMCSPPNEHQSPSWTTLSTRAP